VNQAIPCPYCGKIGYHMWAGEGGCPGAEIQSKERWLEIRIENLSASISEMLFHKAQALKELQELRKGC
jgi:hypothetical protein